MKFDLIIIACIWFALGPAWCACAAVGCDVRSESARPVCCNADESQPHESSDDCDDCLRHHPIHRGEPAPSPELLSKLPTIPTVMPRAEQPAFRCSDAACDRECSTAILRVVCRLNC